MKYVIPIYFAFWMLFGGIMFTSLPIIFYIFMFSLPILTIIAIYVSKNNAPVLFNLGLIFIVTIVLSIMANMDIFWESVLTLLMGFGGLALMVIASYLGNKQILNGLYYAGWIWLLFWPLMAIFGMKDHKNLIAFWPIIVTIAIIAKGKSWLLIIPFIGVLFLVRGRGGLIGTATALLVYFLPLVKKLSKRQLISLSVGSFALFILLVIWNVGTVTVRLDIWYQSILAMMDHNVWFGLGPRGIYARQIWEGRLFKLDNIIPSRLGSYEIVRYLTSGESSPYIPPHAHNIFVNFLTEIGVVGTLLITITALSYSKTRFIGRWQLAILAGVLVYGLVDFPFFFLGPVFIICVIAGTLEAKRNVPL